MKTVKITQLTGAQICKTKGGTKLLLMGTGQGQLFALCLKRLEVVAELNIAQSNVQSICSSAAGLILIALRNQIVSVAVQKNNLQLLG